ncbi:Agamous-like MADS-box protein [Sesamum angolense]|uniref:Agamous-like MADS-box protein n=1 Tax=Sesamum angolense TaxID=2727404 RepID=A0AAE1WDE1_9LAMI|nr:Agamous-like MADS-box protein [Sesamum angolense]
MARGKIQMKRIENPVHRQVTFCKRRAGLLKKAKELSVLCDAEIGLFIFSAHGKLYELATKGSMQSLIERYIKCSGEVPADDQEAKEKQVNMDPKEEISMLKLEIEILQKGLRYISGGGGGAMTLELNVLEKHLEIWIYHVRSAKDLNSLGQKPSGGQGGCAPLWGPRGDAPSEVQGAAPLAGVPLGAML